MKKLIIAALLCSIGVANAAILGPENVNTNTNGNANTNLNTNTQGQAQGQAQGQLQGQLQGQGQMQGNVGIISNDVRNRASSGALSGSESGAASSSGGNNLIVNEAPIPANTSQNIRINDYTIKNVPNVLMGSVYPTSPCMGSSQVGGSGIGFGFSVGSSWTDDECGVRETARSFAGMGKTEDSLAILCTSKYSAAAPSCMKAAAKVSAAPAPAQAVAYRPNASNCTDDKFIAARTKQPICN